MYYKYLHQKSENKNSGSGLRLSKLHIKEYLSLSSIFLYEDSTH